jgi:excisionase family DNA binding protein
MEESIGTQCGISSEDEAASGPGPSLLLTVVEAAEILGISRSTVYELIYARRFPSLKIGNCRRIRRSDLEDFVRDLAEVS